MSLEILYDIEEIYKKAMEKESYPTALRAKELLGRAAGIFNPKANGSDIRVKNLSDADLFRIIRLIEKELHLDLKGQALLNTSNYL
jgi:hypothetical protein